MPVLFALSSVTMAANADGDKTAYELQRFAKCIVSLRALSSSCERNWSTFVFVRELVTSLSLFNSNFSKLFIHFGQLVTSFC